MKQIIPALISGAFVLVPCAHAAENQQDDSVLSEITVTGQRTSGKVSVGALGELSVMEAPISVTGYTDTMILDQGARSTSEVLANDPSIRAQSASDGAYDLFSIRGFSFSAGGFALNGLYGVLPANTFSPEIVEQFEVVRGPSTTFGGASPTNNAGGAVNIQPKHAGDTPLTRFTTSYDLGGQAGIHADVGRRFGESDRWGVRFNAVYRDGELARDNQSEFTRLAFVGADYRGDRLRVSLDAGTQRLRTEGTNFLYFVGEGTVVPEAPETDDNFFPVWAFAKSRDDYMVVRGEFDLTDQLSIFGAVGTHRHDSDMINPLPTILDVDGAAVVYNYYESYSWDTNWSAQSGALLKFTTGALSHQAVLSVSGLDYDIGWAGTYDPGFDTLPGFGEFVSDIYDPTNPAMPSLEGVPSDPPIQLENRLTGYSLIDTISIDDGAYQLILGMRRQKFHIRRLYDPVTPLYEASDWAPSVGFMAKLNQDFSVYANYMTGLSQGQFAPVGTVNQNDQFPPSKTTQYELGVKAQRGDLFASLALFQISQPAGLTDPETNTFSVDGEQRHRGAELTFSGEITPRIRLLGGSNLIDAELTRTDGGFLDGNSAPGVPEFTANVGGEIDFGADPRFTFIGRVIYTSKQYVFGDNLQSIPDWTRLDLGVRAAMEIAATPVTFRINLTNALGEDYWASAKGGGVSLGSPRSVFLSASVSL